MHVDDDSDITTGCYYGMLLPVILYVSTPVSVEKLYQNLTFTAKIDTPRHISPVPHLPPLAPPLVPPLPLAPPPPSPLAPAALSPGGPYFIPLSTLSTLSTLRLSALVDTLKEELEEALEEAVEEALGEPLAAELALAPFLTGNWERVDREVEAKAEAAQPLPLSRWPLAGGL